jgi:hypothetical protein
MNRPAGCSCPSNRNPGDDDGTKCRSQVRAGVAVKSQSQVAVGRPPHTLSLTLPKIAGLVPAGRVWQQVESRRVDRYSTVSVSPK